MKIKIGSCDYELCLANLSQKLMEKSAERSPERKDASSPEDFLVLGYLDECDCSINVEKDSCVLTRKLTFWHEVVHGLLFEIGARELSEDEGLVDALARQLYSFYKNNNIDKAYTYLEKW